MTRGTRCPTFVDAFAGCGGLSLGLMQAGLSGRFAIEKDENAFATLQSNLLRNGSECRFSWPRWLPKKPMAIEALIKTYKEELRGLCGTIDVLAGGPPCQGFSTAGRRRQDDPRNQLFKSYIKLVELLEPKIVLIENVRGFTMDFRSDDEISNYSDKLCSLLSKKYQVHQKLIDVSSMGVPQQRTRYFLVAVDPRYNHANPFELLSESLPGFLRKKGIQTPVSAWKAISDIEISRAGTQPSTESPGFLEICPGKQLTHYQKLMANGKSTISDLRLARHSDEIARRFEAIIQVCHEEGRLNTSVSAEIRRQYGLKKQALRVLDPDQPSPTITSMPDDLLHYKEPRTLTVRENARLQSFPDWFAFHGKYTTGGHRRRHEVPRFTQVANAVPPLAAEAIGKVIIQLLATRPITKPPKRLARSRGKGVMKSAEGVAHL